MSYYRIKINELNNGETRYVPQEGFLRVSGGWIKRQEIRWGDMHTGYVTEEEAVELINSYRQYRSEQEGQEVKSSTYKIIE